MTSSQIVPASSAQQSPGYGYSGALVPVAPAAQGQPHVSRLVSPLSAALALATPAATTTMLVLARHWSDGGARHSIGDMTVPALGAVVGLAGAAFTRLDPLISATCVTGTAACVGVGAMAYPAGLAEPLIVWLAATVFGWVFTRRVVRARKAVEAEHGQRQADRDHAENMAVLQGHTAINIASINAQATVQAARIEVMGQVAASDLRVAAAEWQIGQLEEAWRHRRLLDSQSPELPEYRAPEPPAVTATVLREIAPTDQSGTVVDAVVLGESLDFGDDDRDGWMAGAEQFFGRA